jgi:Putative adhesin
MQKTFDVPGPVTLDLRVPSGDISVDANLDGRVEIELIAHDEESQALVDAARVEQRDERVVVEIPQKRGGWGGFALFFGRGGISCRVRCPHQSNLEVRSKSADVTAAGTLGNVDVRTASGDLGVQELMGDLVAKSASGDTRAERIHGDASVQTASGDVDLGFVRGRALVNAVSGDVRIGQVEGETTVGTVSGDQQHEGAGGSVTSNSVSGDVRVAVRRGSRVFLDCVTVSGDTSSDLEMTGEPAGDGPVLEVRVKTVSGDIRITRAPMPADTTQEVHA